MDPANYVVVHTPFLHPAYVKTFLVTFTLGVLFGSGMGCGNSFAILKIFRGL